MDSNFNAIQNYLLNLGFQDSDPLVLEGEFYVSPWINYELKDNEIVVGNFLLQLKYKPELQIFQITFWGRDFYDEWISSEKIIHASLLVNRVNNKLNLGGFWLDLDEGTLALNSAMVFGAEGLTVQVIDLNVKLLVTNLEVYYPAIKGYVEGEGSIENYESALKLIP
jgi:hypothetical protein